MAKTDWKKIIKKILSADPPRGEDTYTQKIISTKTGINRSTMCRLVSGETAVIDYDSGVKLMSLYNWLIEKGKLKK